MTQARTTPTAVGRALRDYIRQQGATRASYWVGEDAIAAMTKAGADWPRHAGHYARMTAARALLAGGAVTLDLGGWGATDSRSPRCRSVEVSLRDLSDLGNGGSKA